tara:strand:- start:934 stop:2433 length:1500 start_codon:yes stop_codon:yes gene_type:complete
MKSIKKKSNKKNNTQKRRIINRKNNRNCKTNKNGGKRDIHFRTLKKNMNGGIGSNIRISLDGKKYLREEFNKKRIQATTQLGKTPFDQNSARKILTFLKYVNDTFNKIKEDKRIKQKPIEILSNVDRTSINKMISKLEKMRLTPTNKEIFDKVKQNIKKIINTKRVTLMTKTGTPVGTTTVLAKTFTTKPTTVTTTKPTTVTTTKPTTVTTTKPTTVITTKPTTVTTTKPTTVTTTKPTTVTTTKPTTVTTTKPTTVATTKPTTVTTTKPTTITTTKPNTNSQLKSFSTQRKTAMQERAKKLSEALKKKKGDIKSGVNSSKQINDDTFESFKKKKVPVLNIINEINDLQLNRDEIMKNNYKKNIETKYNKYFNNPQKKKESYDKIIAFLNIIPNVKPENMRSLDRDTKNELLYIIEQTKIFKMALDESKPTDEEFDKFISLIVSPSKKDDKKIVKKGDEKDRVINIQITLPEATYVGKYDKGNNNAEVSVGKLQNAMNT